MTGINKTTKRIMDVLISNIVLILSGVVASFIIPNVLSISDYGYYRTFSLYLTYAGLFSFGLVDGIILKYGGCDYDELIRRDFRTYFKWVLIINAFFSILLFSLCYFFNNKEYRFICLALSINIFAVNVSNYFQQISQITLRIKEYSFRRILQAILNMVVVICLFIYSLISKNGVEYKRYIILIVAVNVVLMFWYIYTYRDICLGESLRIFEIKDEIIELCKNGLPLLFANFCTILITAIDRQFINIMFSNEIYATYSFAYSMLTPITMVTSAVYTILYPTLKREEYQSLKDSYNTVMTITTIIVLFMLISYFPLVYIVRWFVPKYIESLPIFRMILPGIAISSTVSVVMRSYYKAFNKSQVFLKRSIITIVLSVIVDCICYKLFSSIESLSISTSMIMLFWYVMCEEDFVRIIGNRKRKNFYYLIVVVLMYFICSQISFTIIGTIMYIVLFLCVSIVFHKESFRRIKKDMLKKSDIT